MQTYRHPFDDSSVTRIFALIAEGLAFPTRPRADLTPPRPSTGPTASAPKSPGMLERIDRWFWKREQDAIDDYLGSSADVFELESRIRTLERANLHQYF